MTPQELQALGERVLEAQPFSRFLGRVWIVSWRGRPSFPWR
ncbi:hypothetical protein ASALC70_02274 [Alcanivorax sp. ALC70]|nr:hypothetical protein ASALC70_02274 [Alcanivorax sp. ALC70]